MNKPLPFAITCVSCGSRLKVTNHDLIGSIDRCPKCGAMVQITAPSGMQSYSGPQDQEIDESLPRPPIEGRLSIGMLDDLDSAAITETAISDIEQSPHSVTPQPGNGIDYRTLAPPNETEVLDNPAGSTEVSASEYRQNVELAWQSESTQKTKQLVLVGLLAFFGLATAGIVFSQFVFTWRKQRIAEPTSTDPVASNSSIDAQPTTEIVPGPSESSVVPSLDPSSVEPSVDVKQPNAAPDVTPSVSEPTMTPTPQAVSESTIATSSPSAMPPLTSSPFELEPKADSTAIAIARDAKSPDAGDDGPKMNKLPPEMLKHLQLFTLETTAPQGPPAIQAPPTIDTVRIDAAAEAALPEVANPTRKPIEVEKALSLQRFAIDNKGASLANLMLIVSQVTTVPIELEFVSFDAANKRIDTPMKTPAGWFSAKQWIDELCASEGLAAQPLEGRMMISASEQAINEGIAPSLRLDDFGDDATVAFQLIEPLLATDEEAPIGTGVLVEGAVEQAAKSRLSEDGRSIVPGASLRSRMYAVFAIESLRLMREMPPKLERWRTARWLGPWPAENQPSDAATFGDWKLVTGGNGGPRLDSPRTAAGLIRSIASLNQSNAVVGWFDAMRQDLFPGDLLMPYSREGTAEGMLDEVLGDYGLQARICGPGIWYIGTEANYDRFEVFTWLPVPPGKEAVIRERLANSLSIADPSSMPIAFENNRMLVRCPRYLARQMPRIVAP